MRSKDWGWENAFLCLGMFCLQLQRSIKVFGIRSDTLICMESDQRHDNKWIKHSNWLMNCAGLEAKISLGGKKSTFNYKLIYHTGWMLQRFTAKILTFGFLLSHSRASHHLGPFSLGSHLLRSPRISRMCGISSSVRVCRAAVSVRQSTSVDGSTRQSQTLCRAWGNAHVITRQEAAESVFNKEVQRKVVLKNLHHLIRDTISILDTGSWLISKGIIRFLLLRQKSPSLPILNGEVRAAPTVYSESVEGKNSLNIKPFLTHGFCEDASQFLDPVQF